jgi:hypothetical protein
LFGGNVTPRQREEVADRPVYSEGHTWPSMANCYDGGVCFDAGPAVWVFFARFKLRSYL